MVEQNSTVSGPRGGLTRLGEYFGLTRIDWIVTAVALPLELINIAPGLLTVLAAVWWQALAYLLAAFVLLLWRRRYPKLVLLTLLLHQALFVPVFHHSLFMPTDVVFNPTEAFSIPYVPLFVVLVGVITVGTVCRPWVSAVLCTPAVIIPTLIFSAGHPLDASWYFVASVLWNGGAWAFGRFIGRSNQRISDLEMERLKLESAMEAERAHIAAELHDIVSHAVTVMLLHAAGGRKIIQTDHVRAAQALDVIVSVGTEATQELSRLLGLLKMNHDTKPGKPLAGLDDVASLVEAVRSAGIDVQIRETGLPRKLDASVGHTAYRAVQEALTNISKHVGPGTNATIALAWMPDALLIQISDTGPAQHSTPTRETSGYGLMGLQQRVAVAGGDISWGQHGEGFMVTLSLPVAKQAGEWRQTFPSVSS